MKKLLLMAFLASLVAVGPADAQRPWQRVHGYVESVQGTQATVRTSDDGRLLTVDMKEVSQSVRNSLRPGEGIELAGFQGAQPNQFIAHYIQKESSDMRRGGVVRGRTVGDARQVIPLIPQFLASQEFQAIQANVRDPNTAAAAATRFYQSFFGRAPSPEEVRHWQTHLVQTGDLRGTLEAFMNSPEYAGRGKGVREGIIDLYQALLGRIPSQAEIDSWAQHVARQ